MIIIENIGHSPGLDIKSGKVNPDELAKQLKVDRISFITEYSVNGGTSFLYLNPLDKNIIDQILHFELFDIDACSGFRVDGILPSEFFQNYDACFNGAASLYNNSYKAFDAFTISGLYVLRILIY